MYIQIVYGWRYEAGARENVVDRVRRAAEASGGRAPLQPDVPGLLGRAFGTAVGDPDEGLGIWIWESKEAAEAYQSGRPGRMLHRTEKQLETESLVTREYDGIYFGHR